MRQTPQKMFSSVAFLLNENAAFAGICQQANMLYPAGKLDAKQDESSPIELYMVSKLGGGWFMPWWYKWYYGITQDEIDQYVLRTLLFFRNKELVLTSLRSGEQALIALLGGGVCAPIMNYLNAMNPIGILLRITVRMYCQVSLDTAGWFWTVKKNFDSLASWMIGSKPEGVTINQTQSGYEIKQGNQAAISHTTLLETVKKQQETSVWQVFKKPEYAFDTATLSHAWNCYWVEQEQASSKKNVIGEEIMYTPKNELARPRTQLDMPDDQKAATSIMLSAAIDRTRQVLSQFEELVYEDDHDSFYEGLCLASESWEVRLEANRQTRMILSTMRNQYPFDSALQANEVNFNSFCMSAEETRKMTIGKIEEKQQLDPWSPEYIENLWCSILEGLEEYQSIKPEGWLLGEGFNAIETQYETLRIAFLRLTVLLGKKSDSELLDEIPDRQLELYEQYRLLTAQLGVEIKNAKNVFHALALDAVGQMRGMYDVMFQSRNVNVSVFQTESSVIIASFVKKTRLINSVYIEDLDEKRNEMEGSLKSFQDKYIKLLDERLAMVNAERVALTITREKEEKPRAEESSDEIPFGFRKYSPSAIEAYQILGVDLGTPRAKLKKAYYDKARICHPDKTGDGSQDFLQLQWAYLYLTQCDEKTLYADSRNVPLEFIEREIRESEELLKRKFEYMKDAIVKIASNVRELSKALSDTKESFDAWVSRADEQISRTDEELKDLKEGFKLTAEQQKSNEKKLEFLGERLDFDAACIHDLLKKLAILESDAEAQSSIADDSHETTPSHRSSTGSATSISPLTFAYNASPVDNQPIDTSKRSTVDASVLPPF